MKRCSRCQLDKPLTEFHKSVDRKDGRVAYCRPCQAERYRAKRQADGKPVRQPADPEGRICLGCHEWLPWDSYGPHSTGLNGRAPRCKTCDNARANQKRRALGVPESLKLRKDADGRECTICGVFKPWSDYYTDSSVPSGHGHRCIPCARQRHREYMSDPDARRRAYAASAEWRRNNPDSYIRSVAKRRAHVSFDVDDRDLRRLMLRQMSKCNHCGVYLDKNVSRFVHLDHIVPLSRGGTHSIGNLQYLCQSCNVRKLDRLEVEVRFGVIYRRGKEVVS